MRFQPGNKAGGGRKPGSKNKAGEKLRNTINSFLSKNFKTIVADFEKLAAKDRAKLYCDLLQYGLPKLQAMSLDLGFEKLSEDQLNEIIQTLIQHNEQRQLQPSDN